MTVVGGSQADPVGAPDPFEAFRDAVSPDPRVLARNLHVIRRRIREPDDDPLRSAEDLPALPAPEESPAVGFLRPARALVSLAVGGSAAVLTGIGWTLVRVRAAS